MEENDGGEYRWREGRWHTSHILSLCLSHTVRLNTYTIVRRAGEQWRGEVESDTSKKGE